jgi:hypothetical protein
MVVGVIPQRKCKEIDKHIWPLRTEGTMVHYAGLLETIIKEKRKLLKFA